MKKGFDWVCEETRMCDVVVCCIKHAGFEKILISNNEVVYSW